MKARVKATGEILEVQDCSADMYVEKFGELTGRLFHITELDFDNLESPDYWTRLEHQYAGMAMQAYIIASHISQFSFCEGDMKDCKSMAHALVEKLKEKEERK